jgi:hypothetical protein
MKISLFVSNADVVLFTFKDTSPDKFGAYNYGNSTRIHGSQDLTLPFNYQVPTQTMFKSPSKK